MRQRYGLLPIGLLHNNGRLTWVPGPWQPFSPFSLEGGLTSCPSEFSSFQFIAFDWIGTSRDAHFAAKCGDVYPRRFPYQAPNNFRPIHPRTGGAFARGS